MGVVDRVAAAAAAVCVIFTGATCLSSLFCVTTGLAFQEGSEEELREVI